MTSRWLPRDVCGVATPTVLLGPQPPWKMAIYCRLYTTGAAEVNVGARPPVDHLTTRSSVINGLHVVVSFSAMRIVHGSPEPTIDQAYVHLPSRHVWISISVGATVALRGGASGRAMPIIHTIRAS